MKKTFPAYYKLLVQTIHIGHWTVIFGQFFCENVQISSFNWIKGLLLSADILDYTQCVGDGNYEAIQMGCKLC